MQTKFQELEAKIKAPYKDRDNFLCNLSVLLIVVFEKMRNRLSAKCASRQNLPMQ